jgi:hypothetical protein
MSLRAVLALLVLPALLAGCATSTLSLSKSELAGIRIEETRVTYKSESRIVWPKAEQSYADEVNAKTPKTAKPQVTPVKFNDTGGIDSSGADDYSRLMATPEAKAHIQAKLTGLIKSRIASTVTPRFNGTRPVRLEIEVVLFSVPPAIQRATLGGSPMLLAITLLKDARTGAELGKLDRGAGAMAGQGVLSVLVDQAFSDLEDRVVDAYAGNVLAWLQRE